MKRVATRYWLLLIITGCSITNLLHADELIKRDEIVLTNEENHQWVNERNGRTGILIVNGALLSSPCILETNEIDLQDLKPKSQKNMLPQYTAMINLVGCGNGELEKSGAKTVAILKSQMKRGGDCFQQPDAQESSGGKKIVLHNGHNQLEYKLNKYEKKVITEQYKSYSGKFKPQFNNYLLLLKLGYE